jgi:hypothetical protein
MNYKTINSFESWLGKHLMDDHIRHSDIHFLCVHDLRTVEIHDSFLENLLHFIHPVIAANFYQSVVNLPQIYLVDNLGSCLATQTTLVCIRS